jgi:hypothetical protein
MRTAVVRGVVEVVLMSAGHDGRRCGFAGAQADRQAPVGGHWHEPERD